MPHERGSGGTQFGSVPPSDRRPDQTGYQAEGVTTAKLSDGAVTTEKIADGAVTAAKVAADVATQAELDAHAALDKSDAHPGTIETADIADAAVTAAKVADDVATQAELDAHTGDTTNPHSVSHGQLGGIGASDHHSRYTDPEARNAVGGQMTSGTYTGDGGTGGRTISIPFHAEAVWVMHTNTDNRPGYWTTSDNTAISGSGSTPNVHLDANGDLVVGDGANDANVNTVPYKWMAIG